MSEQPLLIRDASEADLAAIAAIQAASPEAARWAPGDYLRYRCRVAVTHGAVAGFAVWRSVAEGEHEILNIAVSPGKRRRGVARRLIQSILAEASGVWFLEVRESNKAGRTLYRSLGFGEAGIRPGYYDDSHESGIVMSFCS